MSVVSIKPPRINSIKVGNFLVYPVTRNLVDVFWGNSWKNQARYKRTNSQFELWSKTSALPKGIEDVLKEI